MQPWSGLPCSRVSQSDEADCDSVLSSCERSGTAIREKTGCCGPRDPVVQHLTLGQPAQACSVLAGVLAPGPWVLGLSSNIDNCVVIIVGRHQGPASPVTNYQPTNWVKAGPGARVITLWNNMQICTDSTRQVPRGPDAAHRHRNGYIFETFPAGIRTFNAKPFYIILREPREPDII